MLIEDNKYYNNNISNINLDQKDRFNLRMTKMGNLLNKILRIQLGLNGSINLYLYIAIIE